MAKKKPEQEKEEQSEQYQNGTKKQERISSETSSAHEAAENTAENAASKQDSTQGSLKEGSLEEITDEEAKAIMTSQALQNPAQKGLKEYITPAIKHVVTPVADTLQKVYGKGVDLKRGWDQKKKIAKEIEAAEKYSLDALKHEERAVVAKCEEISKLTSLTSKKIPEYEQILKDKSIDLERMTDEYNRMSQQPRAKDYSRMDGLRGKIHSRKLELAVTESIIENYKALQSKIN